MEFTFSGKNSFPFYDLSGHIRLRYKYSIINPAKFGNHTSGRPQLIPSTVKFEIGQKIFVGKNARV